MEKPNSHCVVYRTGGTVNFQWHRSLAMSRSEAEASAEAQRRMGREARTEDYQRSLAIGLPETFA